MMVGRDRLGTANPPQSPVRRTVGTAGSFTASPVPVPAHTPIHLNKQFTAQEASLGHVFRNTEVGKQGVGGKIYGLFCSKTCREAFVPRCLRYLQQRLGGLWRRSKCSNSLGTNKQCHSAFSSQPPSGSSLKS
jgi:hypothetical protein